VSGRALVLGAGGFLGSHLCHRLVAEGWYVTGTVRHRADTDDHLRGLLGGVRLVEGDVTDAAFLTGLVDAVDAVFPFAGRAGATASMRAPFEDLAVNVNAQLLLLQTLRVRNPAARVVYPGSRLQYGRMRRAPVDESHVLEPTSVYGIHKLTAERYHLLFHQVHGLPTTCLRISTPYGPHQARPDRSFGVVGTFLATAADDRTIELFGTGAQLRDFVFVDDLVDLVVRAAVHPAAVGRVYNVGGPEPVPLRRMAEAVVATVGRGRVATVPWPEQDAVVETGDFVTDCARVETELGWVPTTRLEDGLACSWSRTVRRLPGPAAGGRP